MNTAVLPSYAYNGPPQASQDLVPFSSGAARMSKRRRAASGDYESQSQAGWQQPSSQQQYVPPVVSSFESNGALGGGGAEYAGAATASGASHDTAVASSALNENPDPSGQWNASGASSYPDVSSYAQQPYFYQQSNPSSYNSSWPPAETAPVGAQTNSYSLPASTTTMPFFPSQTPAEPSEGTFDAADVPQSSFQNYQQEVDVPQQYAYVQQVGTDWQARSDLPPGASAFLYEDASMHLKIQSLPILENLATQLIHTIAKASFPQIQEIMQGSDTSEERQAYETRKNLFDQTRKVYSRETAFIDAIAIQMFQPNQQETIRKANIATFISSILGANDVGFFHLNEFFMETFVPLGHRLLKWQGAMYLELKTQAYISALINSDGSPEAMLDELFPPDLDAQILTRHPDAPSLSPSEQDFIDRSRARKSYLLAEGSAEEALQELPKKYQWNDFVREFASCINKNVDGIMNVPARAQPMFGTSAMDRRTNSTAQVLQDSLTRNSQSTGTTAGTAISGVQSLSLNGQSSAAGQPRQRDDVTRKASSGSSAIRQPWTTPEEEALLSGLEKVNGPHWSQILALYGRGGSISEVLKDRNQVQLKDKARNLKLWYLKTGKEVPIPLRAVTGELRKRGGAKARAALGMADEDEQGGDTSNIDGDGDVDVDDVDAGLEQRRLSKSGKGSKKTKKGS